MTEVTQALVRERYDYDPETGVLSRKVPRGGQEVGAAVGSLSESGYLRSAIDGRLWMVHRIIWLWVYGGTPTGEIDHINHDRTDNRIANLRCVNKEKNQQNAARRIDSSSGVTGVTWCKKYQTWRTYIQANKARLFLGHFKNFFDAVCARKSAEARFGFHENHGAAE